jgi:CubicO group peptidase (beta-lactamase class C family)
MATLIIGLLSFSMSIAPAKAQPLSDKLIGLLEEANLNGSVIVTKRGSTVVSVGYGMANYELSLPNTPNTKFCIGSITKQFTAMAILILQDRGQLRVEDPVGKHIRNVPESWQELTIHQLLTHTSGIMHSWDLSGFTETMMEPTTLDRTLERYYDQPLVSQPGSSFHYSGVGYFLLAKIIEVVSEKSFAEFLDAEIFTPLGMHDTGEDRPELILNNRASGYEIDETGDIQNAPTIFMPILTGGGNLYSTVEDLARWDRALSSHALVSEEAYTAMYRPEMDGYAYGWRVNLFEGRQTISHGGSVPGFNAFILRVPEDEICIITLTNLTPNQSRTLVRALAVAALADSSRPRGSNKGMLQKVEAIRSNMVRTESRLIREESRTCTPLIPITSYLGRKSQRYPLHY